jgi:hypothetical protein
VHRGIIENWNVVFPQAPVSVDSCIQAKNPTIAHINDHSRWRKLFLVVLPFHLHSVDYDVGFNSEYCTKFKL